MYATVSSQHTRNSGQSMLLLLLLLYMDNVPSIFMTRRKPAQNYIDTQSCAALGHFAPVFVQACTE